jgi:hypothetical protein
MSRSLVHKTDAVLLVVYRWTIVEPFNPSKVHRLPDVVLSSSQLNVGTVQLDLYVEGRCLKGKTAVDAHHLGDAVLVGVDLVEAS